MSEEFYKNLKNARLKAGLSQVELATKLNVAKSTYSMYESGKRTPKLDTIKCIANILQIDINTLIPNEFVKSEIQNKNKILSELKKQSYELLSVLENSNMETIGTLTPQIKTLIKMLLQEYETLEDYQIILSQNKQNKSHSITDLLKYLNEKGLSQAYMLIELLLKVPEYKEDDFIINISELREIRKKLIKYENLAFLREVLPCHEELPEDPEEFEKLYLFK
ncbi:MAG: helix-turn-helix domain-containing protein [Lachnospiraceae bacterium]|nr:helix-turn-helix domain-containing protein [Lachnospiraceae bacterium]